MPLQTFVFVKQELLRLILELRPWMQSLVAELDG